MNRRTEAMKTASIEESDKAVAKPQEEAGIGKVVAGFEAAWNKHDAEAMAAYWTDDGDLFNPSGRVARGRKEVAKLFTEEQETYMAKTTFAYHLVSIRFVRPDVAIVEKEAVIDGMLDSNGALAATTRFLVFTVMIRGQDGNWLYSVLMPR